MKSYAKYGKTKPRKIDSHVVWALAAILISVGLHLMLMARLANVRMDATVVVPPINARHTRDAFKAQKLKVGRLPVDPLRPMQQPRATQKTAGAIEPKSAGLPERSLPVIELPRGRDGPAGQLPEPLPIDSLLPSTLPPFKQEIVAVLEQRVSDDLAALPRHKIAKVERVPNAPDFALTSDKQQGMAQVNLPASAAGDGGMYLAEPAQRVEPGDYGMAPYAIDGLRDAWMEKFGTNQDDTAQYVPVDDRLAVSLQTYKGSASEGRIYFRLAIVPRTDRGMAALPKDIVFVQDASASLAEERLYFCRRALSEAVAQIGPQDRFNIIAFNDRVFRCFPDWVSPNPETINTATQFMSDLRSEGETDLYASLREILNMPRDPLRPIIAFVVTDGRPTVGQTESSRIIAEITRLNNGTISIFAFGTHSRANTYLLDMLTYCNRGATRIIHGGRWDIPTGMRALLADIRDPVMHDIRFSFDAASGADVHPRLTSNLYNDRPLELFGACPIENTELVFQLRGQAGDSAYDAIFKLDLSKDGRSGNSSIRERWAWQKMYSLISAYAREPRRVYMADLYRLSRDFGLPILYFDEGFVQPPIPDPIGN